MRKSRIKFKKIEELKSWIELLKGEKDFNSQDYSIAQAKINAGEYVESELGLFGITLEELRQRMRSAEEDNELIDNLLRVKYLELRLMYQEKERALKKYNIRAIELEYKTNSTVSRYISVGEESLDKIVKEIRYRINHDKDTIEFSVCFIDDSLIFKSTKIDKVKRILVKAG